MTGVAAGRRARPGERVRPGVAVVLFAVYLALLVWLVLWKLHTPHVGSGGDGRIKLVPFAATSAAGASALPEVVANVLIFVPFGIYLRLLLPSWSWSRAGGLIAGASLLLEAAQFVLAVGVSDVTDVISNTAGGLVGVALAGSPHRGPARSAAMMRVCMVGTAVALVAVAGVVVAFRTRLAPP